MNRSKCSVRNFKSIYSVNLYTKYLPSKFSKYYFLKIQKLDKKMEHTFLAKSHDNKNNEQHFQRTAEKPSNENSFSKINPQSFDSSSH